MMNSNSSEEGSGHSSSAATRLGETSYQLLVRARSGDAAARDRLYHRYLAPLRCWARGRLPVWARDLMDTDDLVQETLMRSLNGLDVFEPRRAKAFQAYLRQGIRNRIRDEIRRMGRQPGQADPAHDLADPGPSPLEETLGREALQRYEKALGRLRSEDREAVLARVELGFSWAGVAETLGKPSADAARMAVSRALLHLAREMADDV